jgi:hypothetical protein
MNEVVGGQTTFKKLTGYLICFGSSNACNGTIAQQT